MNGINNYTEEVNAFIEVFTSLFESKFKIKIPQLLQTVTGKIIEVYKRQEGYRCRVRIAGSSRNGSEDINNVPITTAQEVKAGDNVLICYSGNNFTNAFVSCVKTVSQI